MFCPSDFVWNFPGVGSASFVRYFLLFVKSYLPSIVILLETEVPSSYIHSFLSKSYFIEFGCSEAQGLLGKYGYN